jgi:hypothetical protein
MKYTHIEYCDHTGVKKHPIDKAFYLAMISPVRFPEAILYGINIGISHQSQQDADEFYMDFLASTKQQTPQNPILFLCGDNNTRIPLLYADGNGYEPMIGTSCIFCYVSPLVVGPDKPPPHPSAITGEFGTLALEGKFGRY